MFSQAGITIAKDRARMLPEFAESLIFLKSYMQYRQRYPKANTRPAAPAPAPSPAPAPHNPPDDLVDIVDE